DAFVMPGRGEGFGIVYLEALACGIPVVASKLDAGREAVLDGQLGLIVNPDNPQELCAAIKAAVDRPRAVPRQLEYFSFERFVERWHALLEQWIQPFPYRSLSLTSSRETSKGLSGALRSSRSSD